jgi:hypothetical protein
MRGTMRALLKLALYVHNLDHRCMIQQPIFKVFTFPTFDVILYRICAQNSCGFLFARQCHFHRHELEEREKFMECEERVVVGL